MRRATHTKQRGENELHSTVGHDVSFSVSDNFDSFFLLRPMMESTGHRSGCLTPLSYTNAPIIGSMPIRKKVVSNTGEDVDIVVL